jgi:hypothetical protein
VAALWAVRWSQSAGISVEFKDAHVYFAIQPLSTKLLTRTVDDATYASVDLDVWAEDFLAAVDSFLQPQNAIAVAILDEQNGTTYYDQLMSAKESLANSVPKGLTWILEEQQGTGDMSGAQELLKQALLTSLSSAFTVSTVAQFQAEVKVVGRAEDKASPNMMPPSLYGSVGPPLTGATAGNASPDAPRQYTISNGEVDIANGKQWMTVLVTVAQPKAQAELELTLAYEVSYLQHDFQPGEEYQGYVPSSWIKFVLPDTPPLSMPITGDEPARIPIPLLFYPDAPVLVNQSATAAALGSPPLSSPSTIDQEITEALEWIYTVQIGHNWAHQDELWFTATYNLPVTQQPKLFAAEEVDPLFGLFDALARFRKSYAEISPHFNQIGKEAYPNTSGGVESPGRAQELISIFNREVNKVAAAWARLYEPIFGFPEAETGDFRVIVDDYYLYLDNSGYINLMGMTHGGENPQYWPKVTLSSGASWQPDRSQAEPVSSPGGGWWHLSHKFGVTANLDLLTFEWGPLDVLNRQTATLNSAVRRNANLLGDVHIEINPLFIYTTPSVKFPSPIIPLIQRGELPPLQPEKTLVETLESILKPILGLGRNLNPLLRLGASYNYQLVPVPGGGPGLRASSPILLADNVSLGESGSPVPQIATDIGREIGAWFDTINPSTSQALLSIALTLFGTVAGQQYPLVQIQEIPIKVDHVPAAWWTTAE